MPLRLPHTTPVFLTDEIRRIEALAAAQPDPPPLMERAGLAAAELARELVGDSARRILVYAGPGNNGGDAFVIARHLRQWWFDVGVVYAGDETKLSADATAAMRAWRAAGGTTQRETPSTRCGLVVDGLFGIGVQRDISGSYAALIDQINAMGAPVLAVDVPSGLEGDTGRVLGHAVRAAHTITFIGLKPGLLTLDGPDHCGDIHLATLGLAAKDLVAPSGMIIGVKILEDTLPARSLNTHKGTYGSVGILGGAHGMVGAALLAGRAALKLGTGRVYAGLLADDGPAVDYAQPELMLRSAKELLALEQLDCIAAGPGLSQSAAAATALKKVLSRSAPLVLDADALNMIAADATLQQTTRTRTSPTILTPHPAEAARLLACDTAEVQRERLSAARKLARSLNAGVVLKGAGSVCAWPDDTWAINTSGNPGMASAGMGDVLTGLVAALLAQGVQPKRALLAGVYLHGAAADALVATGTGPVGLVAGELIDAARDLLNRRTA
ncbi:MAG TPA: NAD(P)H-hydrate dehydratase [Burkholderiales bacterium]|nr:NAD(P)H-hydrate dehydratase [Burkholderiales bacterium]